MKGLIAKTVTTICLAGGGLATAGGCVTYHDVVDPCYPERYEYQARQEVRGVFGPQVNNGHILDQTVWNYYFEPGTAKLTPGGMDRLALLARRRPYPDPTVYLQVAHDILFDGAHPDKYVERRDKLDADRIQAVTEYLKAQTAGRMVSFQVVRHDPSEVGMSAASAGLAMRDATASSKGTLGGGGGAAAGGAAPAPGAGGH